MDPILIVLGAILAGLLQLFLILASSFTTFDNPQRTELVAQVNTLLIAGLPVLAGGFAACALLRPRLAAICAAAAILLGVGALAVLVSPYLLESIDGGGAPRDGLTLAELPALLVLALIAAGPGLIVLVYVRAAHRAQLAVEASQQALLDEFRGTSHGPAETSPMARPTVPSEAAPSEPAPAPAGRSVVVAPPSPPDLQGTRATPAPIWPPHQPGSAASRPLPSRQASLDRGPTRPTVPPPPDARRQSGRTETTKAPAEETRDRRPAAGDQMPVTPPERHRAPATLARAVGTRAARRVPRHRSVTG